MAQYKFIKPYSTTVVVGGAVGILPKTFSIGDVVEGTPKADGIEIRIAPHALWNEGLPSNASYQEFLTVPNEYLSLAYPTGLKSPETIFTQRNIVIAVIVIVILILIFN